MATIDLEALYAETTQKLQLSPESEKVVEAKRAQIFEDVRAMFHYLKNDEKTPDQFRIIFSNAIKYQLCMAREYPAYEKALQARGVTPIDVDDFMTNDILGRWLRLNAYNAIDSDTVCVVVKGSLHMVSGFNPDLTLQLVGLEDSHGPEECELVSYTIHSVFSRAVDDVLSSFVTEDATLRSALLEDRDVIIKMVISDLTQLRDFSEKSFYCAAKVVIEEWCNDREQSRIYTDYATLMHEQDQTALSFNQFSTNIALKEQWEMAMKTGLFLGQTVALGEETAYVYRISPSLDVCVMSNNGLQSFSMERFFDAVSN